MLKDLGGEVICLCLTHGFKTGLPELFNGGREHFFLISSVHKTYKVKGHSTMGEVT